MLLPPHFTHNYFSFSTPLPNLLRPISVDVLLPNGTCEVTLPKVLLHLPRIVQATQALTGTNRSSETLNGLNSKMRLVEAINRTRNWKNRDSTFQSQQPLLGSAIDSDIQQPQQKQQ